MKTRTINVYSFNELSDKAKETAIDHFRNMNDDYFFTDEANESFKKFADIFNINWRSIDYQEPNRNEYSIKLDDNILELSGLKLAKHIWNNYKSDIFKGKYYGKLVNTDKYGNTIEKSKLHPAGFRHVKRYSKITLDNSCVLTGVCYDDDLLTPIYNFLNKPNERIDFETLLNDCIYSLCHSVSSEIDYQNSDEAITETIEANEYEFDESGNLI